MSASPTPRLRAARVAPGAAPPLPTSFAVRSEGDVPPEPGPGQVRVRVEACGICGSDLHFYHGGLWPPGRVPGHEMVGRVEALGSGVVELALGDRVAVEPIRSCGGCRPCRSGRDNLCRDFQVLGIHVDGGLRDRLVVDAFRCFPMDPELDPAVAALCEPVAVSIHGLLRAGFEPGVRVLVLGAGSVGLTSVLAARALGASEVWASARYDAQASRARELGASRVLPEEEAGPEALSALSRETDFDVVVETVGGRAPTLPAAVAALAPGGCVCVLGLFLGTIELEPFPLLLKEATLAWSNCYDRRGPGPADFRRAADLVAEERERLAGLVTHRFGLDRVEEAFATAADKRSGAVKVGVLPGAGP